MLYTSYMSNSVIQNLPIMYINMNWSPELNPYVPDPNFIPNYQVKIDEYLMLLATEGQMSCVIKERMNSHTLRFMPPTPTNFTTNPT